MGAGSISGGSTHSGQMMGGSHGDIRMGQRQMNPGMLQQDQGCRPSVCGEFVLCHKPGFGFLQVNGKIKNVFSLIYQSSFSVFKINMFEYIKCILR